MASESGKVDKDQVVKISASAEKSERCSKQGRTTLATGHKADERQEGGENGRNDRKYVHLSVTFVRFLLLLLKVPYDYSESLKKYFFKCLSII